MRWLVATLALLTCAAPARARSAGLAAPGCDGCHSGGKTPMVTLSAEPSSADVGELVTLTITVSPTNGASAGFYLTTAFDAPGVFGALESGTAVDASGALHTTPRTGSGGSTVFRVAWTATRATGVAFEVFALSANGDRSVRGDGAGTAHLDLTAGCTGAPYYIDQDGDGFGSDDPVFRPRLDCALPLGYAAKAGDCNDFRAQAYPGAPEQCDLLDNDCDGAVDEEVVNQTFCADADGDGHGAPSGVTKIDCKPSEGFGACDGDCDDRNEAFHPGAEEVCDLLDNDCDGEVDEGVRPVCGFGLCARRARSCREGDCTPGEPVPETCNAYDDDCDGVADNGDPAELCGNSGSRCVAGHCVGDSSPAGAPPTPNGVGGTTGSVAPGNGLDRQPGASCGLGGRTGGGGWLAWLPVAAWLLRTRPRRARRPEASIRRAISSANPHP